MSKIKVAIAEDQILFVDAICTLLNKEKTIKVTLRAANGRDLLDQLKIKKVDVLLLDLEMPILSGRETLEIIKIRYPNLKVIILTKHNEDSVIIEMIERGANGFLNKDVNIETLMDAIICVVETDFYFNKRMKEAVNNQKYLKNHSTKNHLDFTFRELDILKMICNEMTNNEISEKLNIGRRTVESYRTKIIHKIGCRSTAGIVFYAARNNLLLQ